ncbi:carbamoyltransferase HypF [Atlantibacter sp. RC6]|uniref:carbamoyltransferase HypF n=1 Tax=Atlantibacter sp. RC6 TaxID=2587036 RepID=UPI0016059F55|nr:carbamoyltransferase HypF [Atlantibacter sp. RC6]MBB3322977.1 hydrogenase maturation protein HypF [Atlantibacter sp. RC6]
MTQTPGVQLHIRGKVQGVGFRPFVWQLAQRLDLKGDVCNTGNGVVVRIAGSEGDFVAQLYAHCPPLAAIHSVARSEMVWDAAPQDFIIVQSQQCAMDTQIVPDAATCPACLEEINTPGNRRYRYPFTNCTHCGPRLTIIQAMPYDRAYTVMAAFPLCLDCEREYRNPLDRRFHAQPLACPVCGPQLFWRQGDHTLHRDDALNAAVAALRRGEIVAIKGLGGMHLAVDARSDRAVLRLRERKQRPVKPLAVMLPDGAGLPDAALSLLHSPAAPVVLVEAQIVSGLSRYIAPGLGEVGVMLPANPLQHLLLQEYGAPLVMTSGNLNGKPPAITNQQALDELADIADGWLLHNRDINQRMDDSVVRQSGEVMRRARGYVPDAIALPPGFEGLPPILAVGADLKNTFCLLRGNSAVLSQHLGDLTEERVPAQWQLALKIMRDLYDFTPARIVVDAHPGYISSQMGREMDPSAEVVLHHHAHAAACLAEHQWPLDGGAAIALTLDGIGYGADDQLWGGECLLVDYVRCERLGGLPAVALPGGDLAARQPWRNLLAQWQAFVPDWQTYPDAVALTAHCWQVLARAIERQINAPLASSTGRLFDAVACALGLAPDAQSYEGEAACWLEALAMQAVNTAHPVTLPFINDELDMATFWRQWLAWQAPDAERAYAFHDALAQGFADMARHHARLRGINTLVFSGGVLHNQLLKARFTHYLADFDLRFPMQLPAGDGAVSFGQVVVAAARWLRHQP